MLKVSLIVPVYNAEPFLARTLESIITSPAFDKLEVLLINDGSKDCSGQIADEYAQKYDNIFAYHQPNGGVSSARNYGIRCATTQNVMFLDSDDILECGISDLIESADRADLAVAGFRTAKFVNSTLMPLSNVIPDLMYATTTEEIRDLYFSNFQNKLFLTSCGKIYKKQILDKHGLQFNSNQIIGEDGNFVQEYIRHCKTVICINNYAFSYMVDASASATKKVNTKHFTDMKFLHSRLLDFASIFNATPNQHEIISNYYYRSCCFFVEGIQGYFSGKDYIKQNISDKTVCELNKTKYSSKENTIYALVFGLGNGYLLYLFCKLRKVLKRLMTS